MISFRPRVLAAAAALCGLVATTVLFVPGAAAADPATVPDGAYVNPVLGDGSSYSADPGALVDGDTLYIYAGRDEAAVGVNDFVMKEWQAFSTTDGRNFAHHPDILSLKDFSWATANAWAGDVVKRDGKYYYYVPVQGQPSQGWMTIGVAVGDSPLGPFTDYAGGPIVTDSIAANGGTPTGQTIDPKAFVDDDGQAYLYFGGFWTPKVVKLKADMKTLDGPVQTMTGLTGYFEAPWVWKRDATYYMAYAANDTDAGAVGGRCTDRATYACIRYATATSPTGPWTMKGILLDPVSSTTSHPAVVDFKGQSYLVYANADAQGGGNFRRSVALDRLYYRADGTIEKVVQTPDRADLAASATVTASSTAAGSLAAALADGIVPDAPATAQTWRSGTDTTEWAGYTWPSARRVDHANVVFAAPSTAGADDPAVPKTWRIEYSDAGTWKPVTSSSTSSTAAGRRLQVDFGAVTTDAVRLVVEPDGSHPVAVTELEVDSVQPSAVAPVTVRTAPTVQPVLPSTVSATFGSTTLTVPVRWDAVAAGDLAAAGVLKVSGRVDGVRTPITATVVVADPGGAVDQALFATASASVTAGWNRVGAVNDGIVGDGSDQAKLWGLWPAVGEQWVQLTWPSPVTVGSSGMYFYADSPDSANAGTIPPKSWRIQSYDDATSTWVDVANPSAYGRERGAYNPTTFTPVTTTKLRALLQAWGTAEAGGSPSIAEWQVFAADGSTDTTAPTLTSTAAPVAPDGTNGWYRSAVTLSATATDDTDPTPKVEADVDGQGWVPLSGPLSVTTDGAHQVRLRATDASGNASVVSTWSGKLDRTAPVSKTAWDAGRRIVTILAADDTSSVGGVTYALGSGPWQAYTGPITVGSQATSLQYRSTDAAGNVEKINTLAVPAKATVLAASTLTAKTSSTPYGTRASLSITARGSGGTATGTVRVLDQGVEIARGSLVRGTLVLRLPANLAVGAHRLTVRYLGDTAHAGSEVSASAVVTKARTTLAVATAVKARRVSVTATVTAQGFVPSERVRVTVSRGGAVKTYTGVLTGGRVTITSARLTAGRYDVVVASLGSAQTHASRWSGKRTV